MASEYNEYFLDLNKNLIWGLEDKIKEYRNREGDRKEIEAVEEYLIKKLRQDYVEKYKDNIFMLAKYQLGLSKLLDYYSYDWIIDKKIDKLVTEITVIALNISYRQVNNNKIKHKCDGLHDDMACEKNVLGRRFGLREVTLKRWPRLPARDANTFLNRPVPDIIVPGQKLYRIIKDGVNSRQGSFWILESDLPIKSKKDWRSDFAVLETWNMDNDIVVLNVKKPMYVWVGVAASQQATDECILPGGDFKTKSDVSKKQVWVDRKDIVINENAKEINWNVGVCVV